MCTPVEGVWMNLAYIGVICGVLGFRGCGYRCVRCPQKGGCAVGKDTKISMNLRASSACRASAIKKGKTYLKRKCIDAE